MCLPDLRVLGADFRAKDRPFVKALVDYVIAKSAGNADFQATLKNLLTQQSLKSSSHVGFVFSARLVNMPVQLVPPMYNMLQEEIQWAIDDVSPT